MSLRWLLLVVFPYFGASLRSDIGLSDPRKTSFKADVNYRKALIVRLWTGHRLSECFYFTRCALDLRSRLVFNRKPALVLGLFLAYIHIPFHFIEHSFPYQG